MYVLDIMTIRSFPYSFIIYPSNYDREGDITNFSFLDFYLFNLFLDMYNNDFLMT